MENVQNPWGGDFQAGDGLVMGNFTQQHFCEICVKSREAGGITASFGGALEGQRRVCYNKFMNFTADTAFGGT